NRILIVDQEPQFPPELIAKINKVTNKKRRRGPSKTVQGAALAVAAMLAVVVLAKQAGLRPRPGRPAAGPSPAPGPDPEPPARPPAPEPRTTSRSRPGPKPKPKTLAARVIETPPSEPALLPIPYRVASTSPIDGSVAVPGTPDDPPAAGGSRYK